MAPNAPFVLLLAALLAMTPLWTADTAGHGLPRPWCESPADMEIHEYAPVAVGVFAFLPIDASIPPCPYGDTTWDGHYEFVQGGAILQAAASVCTTAYPDHAPQTMITVVDEVWAGEFDVAGRKVVLHSPFSVYADTLNNDPIPSDPNCGDFQSDYGIQCLDSCVPGFPPGLDGTYQVFVSGVMGHVIN